jgi:ferritin-like metal-binding protein YciE
LKDIHCAEKKIFRTLPKIAKAAEMPELTQAFMTHREKTQGHIERLEQVFEMLGKRPQAKPCEAINGVVAEGEETIEDFGGSAAIDTGLVVAGQAVEHYEMARYGTLIAWAGQLNMPKAAEEMKAEKLLTQIGATRPTRRLPLRWQRSGRIALAASIESSGSRGILGRATNREK